jgi:hypothetical protein
LTINGSEAYTITYQPTDVLLTVVSTGPAVQTAYHIGSIAGASHLTAALNEFNAAYATGGRQAIAIAIEAALSRQRMQEHIGVLNPLKKAKF